MFRDGPLPYAARLAAVCTAFTCTPDVAAQLDEESTQDVLDAIAAVRAKAAFEGKGEMSEAEATMYQRLMEAADLLADEAGEPDDEDN